MTRPLVVALCLVWLAFTQFPLYWTVVTALKPPAAVFDGPTYLPFIDFQPTLQGFREVLGGTRGGHAGRESADRTDAGQDECPRSSHAAHPLVWLATTVAPSPHWLRAAVVRLRANGHWIAASSAPLQA